MLWLGVVSITTKRGEVIMDKNLEQDSQKANQDGIFTCPECGSKNISTHLKNHNFKYGIEDDKAELSVEVPVRICGDCSFSYRDHAAEVLCHEAICCHLGVMSPSEIKALRKSHKFTQSQFSEVTKLGEATLSRWERGIVIQNEAYNNYLYLLKFHDNLERIRYHSDSSETGEATEDRSIKKHDLIRPVPGGFPRLYRKVM